MIARRENLDVNINNNLVNKKQINSLKEWEKEKEKLIKDNVSLMKLNVQLSNQIKQLISLNNNNNV